MEAYKTINQQEIFSGKIFRVNVDEITLPNGRTAKREIVVNHHEAVGMLAVDDDGFIFLVRQYRHPLGALVLEIPAGMMEHGEKPEDCARRELEEEIGYRAERLDFICTANNAVGMLSDRIYLYIARGLTKTAQNLDADEFLTIEKHSIEDCERMIKDGEIIDSKTILAIYAYMLNSDA